MYDNFLKTFKRTNFAGFILGMLCNYKLHKLR